MQLWSDNACKCFVINLFIIHFIYLIKSHWKLSGFYMIFTHLVQGNYSHAKIQQTCLNVHLSAYATLCKSRYECKDHWNDCIRDSTTRDTKYDCSFVCIDFFYHNYMYNSKQFEYGISSAKWCKQNNAELVVVETYTCTCSSCEWKLVLCIQVLIVWPMTDIYVQIKDKISRRPCHIYGLFKQSTWRNCSLFWFWSMFLVSLKKKLLLFPEVI